MSNHELHESEFILPTLDTRVIGDRVMRVTVLPPENPAVVMERDRIAHDPIGSRPMDVISSHPAGYANWGTTRKAPNLVSLDIDSFDI